MTDSLKMARPRPLAALRAGTLVLAVACSQRASRPSSPAVPVSVDVARRASVPYVIQANGLVSPFKTAMVASQVDGIIAHVDFREGQDVSQGQLLFQIDPRPYEAAYKQAQANLARDRAIEANALREAQRYDSLVKQDYVTHEQADQQRATAEASKATVAADAAAVANALFNVNNTSIRAPIAGRTGSLLVREGNLVHANASSPLVVINQISPILVRFSVPASQLPLIQRFGSAGGLPVTATPGGAPEQNASDTTAGVNALTVGSGDDSPPAATPDPAPVSDSAGSVASILPAVPPAHGTLSFVDNAVDTTTGTVLLKASFPNTNRELWAGQFVSTRLRLFVEQNALVVPTAAVVTGQEGTYVYVVDTASAARQRKVTVERTAGDLAIITSGAREGDHVVVAGQARLTPGAKVTVAGSAGAVQATAGAPASPRGGRSGGRGNKK